MHWVPNACNKNLSLELVILKYLMNLANQAHSILASIVQSSNKWTDIFCSSLCSQYCLVCRKHQGNIDWNSFCCKTLASFESIWCHWTLDNNIISILAQSSSFIHHSRIFCTNNLKAYIAFDYTTNFFHCLVR